MRGMTLLVVDDEIWIRHKLIHRFDWNRFGIDRLLEAEDGEKALALMRNERVDIVITDMDMPFMDGADMMQIIRAEFPETRVVALSGYSDFETVHGALVGGAVEYLLKPVQEKELYAVIEKLTGTDRAKAVPEESPAAMLHQVRRYIDAHYAEELSLTQLAELFALSPSYLSRSFKRAFGVNLSAYITAQRLEAARRLLDEGRMSITQVAAETGYADYAYFSNLFRKQFGCSPREYQKAEESLQDK